MTISSVTKSAPSASGDLFHEAYPKSTLLGCRAITDDIIHRAVQAIKTGLPQEIISLTDLMRRADEDPTCIFHPSHDCRWQDESTPETTSGSDSDEWSPSRNGAVSTARQRDGPLRGDVIRPPQHVTDLFAEIRPIARELVTLFDLVQLYIVCMTPAVEEGNNTGVEVQQHCLRAVNDARRYALGVQTHEKLWHEQRAKLVSKVLKYPAIEDYRRALAERDAEECRDCRYLLGRLRVQVVAVVDPIHKNYNRVTEPKGASSGGAGMY